MASKRALPIAIATHAVLLQLGVATSAATRNWNVAGGNTADFMSAGSWSPTGSPGSGDTLIITNNTTTGMVLNNSVSITEMETSGGGTVFYLQGNTLNTGRFQVTGTLAGGATAILDVRGQNGIINVNTPANIYVGYQSSRVGRLKLYDTTVNIAGGDFYLGYSGTGYLLLNNSLLNSNAILHVNRATNSSVIIENNATLRVPSIDSPSNMIDSWTSGTIDLTASGMNIDSSGPIGSSISLSAGMNIKATDRIYVGRTSNGVLTVNGGSVSANGSVNNINLGDAVGTTGTVNLGSGSISSGYDLDVGQAGSGLLTQTGGTLSLGHALYAGVYGAGTYSVTNGTATMGALYISSGGGTGTVTINAAATVTATSSVTVFASAGKLNLNGGVLNAGYIDVGGFDSRFNWSSGVLNLTASDLYLGGSSGTFASLNLIPAKSLSVSAVGRGVYVGPGGLFNLAGGSLSTSFINQSGGTVNGPIEVSSAQIPFYVLSGGLINSTQFNVSTGGILNLSGGVLTAPLLNQSGGMVTGNVQIGTGNISTYSLTNGTLNPSHLQISAGGALNISGGLLSCTQVDQSGGSVEGPITIGQGYISTYNIRNGIYNSLKVNIVAGGTLNLSGGVMTTNLLAQSGGSVLGRVLVSSAAIGAYNLSSGSLVPLSLNISSGGLLTQTGGSITLTYDIAATGTANGEFIGLTNDAMFNQSGGTNTTAASTLGINVGTPGGGSGLYLISGSAAVSSSAISIDRGAVNQSGGSSNVSLQSLYVASNPGSSGSYTLAGGSLTVSQTYEFIGNSGIGSFNQTGGSHTIGTANGTGYLLLGVNSGSSGSYILGGATLTAIDAEYIGIDGNAIFNQSGGTNTTLDLTIAIGSGQGRYNLQAGTLNTNSLTVNNNGTFNQTGGSFNTSNIAINSGGSVTLGSNEKLTNLTIDTTPGSSAKLDVTSHDLIVQNTDVTTVVSLIITGKLISTTAANNAKHLTTLGVITNGMLYGPAKPFDGFIPGPADVLVKYTYYGDANLDGKVDGSDYSRIDSGYLTHTTGWLNGDFNYDGTVNGSDYTLIDNAYNTQGVILSTQIATASSQIAAAAGASVPEPQSLALLSLATAGLLGRRRDCRTKHTLWRLVML